MRGWVCVSRWEGGGGERGGVGCNLSFSGIFCWGGRQQLINTFLTTVTLTALDLFFCHLHSTNLKGIVHSKTKMHSLSTSHYTDGGGGEVFESTKHVAAPNTIQLKQMATIYLVILKIGLYVARISRQWLLGLITVSNNNTLFMTTKTDYPVLLWTKSSFTVLWTDGWAALCAAAVVQLQGSVDWVQHQVFTHRGSITADQLYSLRRKVATTSQEISPFQTDMLGTGTARVK